MNALLTRCSTLVLICSAMLLLNLSTAWADNERPAEKEGLESKNGNVRTQMTFVNQSKKEVKVYWLNYEGKRVLYATLVYGQNYFVDTFMTHPWLVTDLDGTVRDVYMPTVEARKIIITEPAQS